MRGIEILKKKKKNHFCDVHISFGEKQILETRCIKQHAFLVDPLGVSHDFRMLTTVFLHRKWEAQNKTEDRNLSFASKFRSPKLLQKRAHSVRAFRVWGNEKGPVLAAHPVYVGDMDMFVFGLAQKSFLIFHGYALNTGKVGTVIY